MLRQEAEGTLYAIPDQLELKGLGRRVEDGERRKETNILVASVLKEFIRQNAC